MAAPVPFPPAAGTWVPDLFTSSTDSRDETGRRAGLVWGSGVPVLVGAETLGVLQFFSTQRHHFVIEAELAMRHPGTQPARVVERERAERRPAALALEVVRRGGDVEPCTGELGGEQGSPATRLVW